MTDTGNTLRAVLLCGLRNEEILLYNSHMCSIIRPLSRLEHACVSPLSVLIPLCYFCEELMHDIITTDNFSSFSSRMQIVLQPFEVIVSTERTDDSAHDNQDC